MILRILFYLAGLACCTLLIWHWNCGAQRRRYFRACRTPQPWTPEDAPFLALIEKAYGLPKGAARNLPHDWTPMRIYLTLYPEHCIYDQCENEHFLRDTGLTSDDLSRTFAELRTVVSS